MKCNPNLQGSVLKQTEINTKVGDRLNLFELAVKIEADTTEAKKSISEYRKDVMNLAQTYKKQGMDMSSAMKKAYSEIDKSQYETAENSKNDSKKFSDNWADAGEKVSEIAKKIGNGLKTAAKIGAAAVGAAAAGITALTTAAVNNYAEYEQLVGGVETLFKDSAGKVQEYAANAYKTAGMSANEYMSTVTGFSAALLRSVGGDTEKAAKLADTAITDMSDNANKMGVSLESLQNAYTGFSRGNFTMLDNLALGFSGTKEGMQELLDTAKELSGVEYDIESYADIVEAIHVVQTEMGITGTTAKEAGTTIQGSVASMKSAWTNLLTGLADGNADVGELVNNLVTTIVGDGSEENLGVFGNIMPAVQTALTGASTLISELLPQIVQIIPTIITENLPILAEAAISIIQSLVDGISQNQEMLMKTAFDTIVFLANSLISMLPQIVQLGLDLIVSLANGITDSLPELIPTVIDVVLQIVDTLTNPETLSNLLDAALVLMTELAYGLMDAIPELVDATLTIIESLVAFLTDPVNIGKLLLAAVEIIIALGTGIVNAIPRLLEYWKKVPQSIIENFKSTDWGKLGTDLVEGFKNGISRSWKSLKTWFKNLFGDLIDIAKKILGIASPSKVFRKIGGFTAEGFGAGFEDEFAHVKNDMENALNFDDASVGINASIRKVGMLDNGIYSNGLYGGRNVSVVQNIYSKAQTAADLMMQARYQAEQAVFLSV